MEIILATLINLSLWAEQCLFIFIYYFGAFCVGLRSCCPRAESGRKHCVDSSSTGGQRANSSTYLSPKLLLPCRVGPNQLVSGDQVAEVGSKQGRGEARGGELEHAFGQLSVVLCSA